jgi:RHS repeat-associated protein
VLATRTEPDGTTHRFAYDTELRLTQVTNPAGLTWTYTYDPAGRLTSETDYNGRTLTYSHNAAGDLLTRTNGAGQTLTFTRDLLGRTTRKSTDSGESTTYAYDPSGRLIHAAGADTDLSIERDALGRVLTETVNGRTSTFTYDPAGRTTSRTTPSGLTSAWTYDPAGRATGLRTTAGSLAFAHDEAGRETERRVGDGVTLAQTWDAGDQVTVQTVTRHRGADRLLQHRAYAYRADGYLTEIRELTSGTRHFDLDPLGRVTAVHAHGWSETYAYDTTGNLTHATAPAHPSPGDREFSGTIIRRAGRTRYEHDAQGRLIRRIRKLLNGQTREWTYTWNAEDRLTDVTTPTGEHWHYTYDPFGRRIAKERLDPDGNPARTITFAWEGTRLAEQSTADDRHTTWDYAPGTHRPLTQTNRSADGSPITQLAQTPRFHAIVTDPAGTPTELVTPGGDIVWQHRTGSWGTPLPAPPDAADCPLRYPGQYADPETGLHYNFHRYYDPETSRYLAPDPLGLTPAANPSGYVHNPYTWSDPLGLAPKCPEARAKSATDKIIERAQEGRIRKDSNYHPHFGDDRVMEILREPDAVYLSVGGS